MTSPPPSETGATAEAMLTIVARGVMGRYACDALAPSHEHDDSDCQNCRMELRIVAALLAAKRSAHLEDARALCDGCKREGAPHHPPNRIKPGPDDWWHENAIRCHAGPIWDALSRTGAKE